MKLINVLYSINFTIEPAVVKERMASVEKALDVITEHMKEISNLTCVFFVDILMMLFIREQSHDMYQGIYKKLFALYQKGHSIELLINMAWEHTEDIHSLDVERILDIFALGKYVLKPVADNNKQDGTPIISAIRMLNGKLQPFSYLTEPYQMAGIKLDASVFPNVRATGFYDYSDVTAGSPYRFSSDPNIVDRFGRFIEMPRSIYKQGARIRWGMKSFLNRNRRKTPEHIRSFLLEETIVYNPMLVNRQKHYGIATPDLHNGGRFMDIIKALRSGSKSILSIESNFEYMSPLTFKNIKLLSDNKSIEFISIEEIIDQYLITNKVLFK